jgi:hypothetical protein
MVKKTRTDAEALDDVVDAYRGMMAALVEDLVQGGAKRRDIAFMLERLPDGRVTIAVATKTYLTRRYMRDPAHPMLASHIEQTRCWEDPEPLVFVFSHEGQMAGDGDTLGEGETLSGLRHLAGEVECDLWPSPGSPDPVVAIAPDLARFMGPKATWARSQ